MRLHRTSAGGAYWLLASIIWLAPRRAQAVRHEDLQVQLAVGENFARGENAGLMADFARGENAGALEASAYSFLDAHSRLAVRYHRASTNDTLSQPVVWALSQVPDYAWWVQRALDRLSAPPYPQVAREAEAGSSLAEMEAGIVHCDREVQPPTGKKVKLWQVYGADLCLQTKGVLDGLLFGAGKESYARCPRTTQCYVYRLSGKKNTDAAIPYPCTEGGQISVMTSKLEGRAKEDDCPKGECMWFRLKDCEKKGSVKCQCLNPETFRSKQLEEVNKLSALQVAILSESEELPGFDPSEVGSFTFEEQTQRVMKRYQEVDGLLQQARASLATVTTQNEPVCDTEAAMKCQKWANEGPGDPWIPPCTKDKKSGNDYCHCRPGTECHVECVHRKCTPKAFLDRGQVASEEKPILVPCSQAKTPVKTIVKTGGSGGSTAYAFKIKTCDEGGSGHRSCECVSPTLSERLADDGEAETSKVSQNCAYVKQVLGADDAKESEAPSDVCLDFGEIMRCTAPTGALMKVLDSASEGLSEIGDSIDTTKLKHAGKLVGREILGLLKETVKLGNSIVGALDQGLGLLVAPLDGRYKERGLFKGLMSRGLGAAVEHKIESVSFLQATLQKILKGFALFPYLPASVLKKVKTIKDLTKKQSSSGLNSAEQETFRTTVSALQAQVDDPSVADELVAEPLALASSIKERPAPGTFCTQSAKRTFQYLSTHVAWGNIEKFVKYGLPLSADKVGYMSDPITGEAGAPVYEGTIYTIGDTELVLRIKVDMILGLDSLLVQKSNCEGDILNLGMYCDLTLNPGISPVSLRSLNAQIRCKKENCIGTTADAWTPDEALRFLSGPGLELLPRTSTRKARLRFIPGLATLQPRRALAQAQHEKNTAKIQVAQRELDEAQKAEAALELYASRRHIKPGEYEIEELGQCTVVDDDPECDVMDPHVPAFSQDFGTPKHLQAKVLDAYNNDGDEVVSIKTTIAKFGEQAVKSGAATKVSMRLRQTHRWKGNAPLQGEQLYDLMNMKDDGEWYLKCDDKLSAQLAAAGYSYAPGEYPIMQIHRIPAAGFKAGELIPLDDTAADKVQEDADSAYDVGLGDSCGCDGRGLLRSQVGERSMSWYDSISGVLGYGSQREPPEDEPEECRKTVLDQELDIDLKNLAIKLRLWFRKTYSVQNAGQLTPVNGGISWAAAKVKRKARELSWLLKEAIHVEDKAESEDALQRRAQTKLREMWIKDIQANRVTSSQDYTYKPMVKVLGGVVLGHCVSGGSDAGCASRTTQAWCEKGDACTWRSTATSGGVLRPERAITLWTSGGVNITLVSTYEVVVGEGGCECALGREHGYSKVRAEGFCDFHSERHDYAWCATVTKCGTVGAISMGVLKNSHWTKCDYTKPNGMSPVMRIKSISGGSTDLKVGDQVVEDDFIAAVARAAAKGDSGSVEVRAIRPKDGSVYIVHTEIDLNLKKLSAAFSLHVWNGVHQQAFAMVEERRPHQLHFIADYADFALVGAVVKESEGHEALWRLSYRLDGADGADVQSGNALIQNLTSLRKSDVLAFEVKPEDILQSRVLNLESELGRLKAGGAVRLNLQLSGETCERKEATRDVECTWWTGKCVPDGVGATKEECKHFDLNRGRPDYKRMRVATAQQCEEASKQSSGKCKFALQWNRRCLKVGVSGVRIEPLTKDFVSVRPRKDRRAGRCAGDSVNEVGGSVLSGVQLFGGIDWLIGKVLADPVVSIGHMDGPWGQANSLRWLHESSEDGSLVCPGCGSPSAPADLAEFTVLDVRLCAADPTKGHHWRFRANLGDRTVHMSKAILLAGIRQVQRNREWIDSGKVATGTTQVLMQAGTWWIVPDAHLERLREIEEARERGWLERWSGSAIGAERAAYFARLAGDSTLDTLESLAREHREYVILSVDATPNSWPTKGTTSIGSVKVQDLLLALEKDALGDIRLAPKKSLTLAGKSGSVAVPAGSVLQAISNAGEPIWNAGVMDDGVEALQAIFNTLGVGEQASVDVSFNKVPSLEEWLASLSGSETDTVKVILSGGCDCSSGWAGENCTLALPRASDLLVADELAVDGTLTLATRQTRQNCAVANEAGDIKCDQDLEEALRKDNQCTDMKGAVEKGRLDITKGVFQLTRAGQPGDCPQGNCHIHCDAAKKHCTGELMFLQLLGTERYCRMATTGSGESVQHRLRCDSTEKPWRCAGKDVLNHDACMTKTGKTACTSDSRCIVQPAPFVLRGSLDAFHDSAFWQHTFKMVLGGAGAAAAIFIGSMFVPFGAVTYLAVMGLMGAAGGLHYGAKADTALGGLQGTMWSIGRQMRDVRKSLYNVLDVSLEGLYEVDEFAYGGFGDIVAG